MTSWRSVNREQDPVVLATDREALIDDLDSVDADGQGDQVVGEGLIADPEVQCRVIRGYGPDLRR